MTRQSIDYSGAAEPASRIPSHHRGFAILMIAITLLVNTVFFCVLIAGEKSMMTILISLIFSPIANAILILAGLAVAVAVRSNERFAPYAITAIVPPLLGATTNLLTALVIVPWNSAGPSFGTGIH